ncbi:MAG: hypothetical protein ACRCX2_20335 [Paraclostridium sp.]
MIIKDGDEYILFTKDGEHVLGKHDTYQEALAQERAIQISKHLKEHK